MENNGRVAFSWIEVIAIFLLVILAMGLFALFDWIVTDLQLDRGTTSTKYEIAAGVPRAEADLAVLTAERDLLQEALAARKAAQAQAAISLTVTAGQYPTPDAAPTDVIEARATQEAELTVAADFIPLLETRQATAVVDVGQAQVTLEYAQQLSNFRQQTQILTFSGGTLAILFGVLTLLGLLLGVNKNWEFNGFKVIGAIVALLLLLYGFAAFEWVGAAAGAIILLFGLAVFLALRGLWRRIRRET